MRIVFFLLITVGLGIAVTQIPTLRAKVPALSRVPTLSLRQASEEHIAIDVAPADSENPTDDPQVAAEPESPQRRVGKIAGISTDALAHVFTGISTAIGSGVNAIVASSPSPDEVIDVSSVVVDITNRVEAIPSTALSQAKVAYCRQVLEQATRSAEPTASP